MSAPTRKSSSLSASSKTPQTRTAARPGSWRYDPDEFDREILAARLPGTEFDSIQLTELLCIARGSLWPLIKRGKIPPPHHYVQSDTNRDRAIWRAEQLVGLL